MFLRYFIPLWFLAGGLLSPIAVCAGVQVTGVKVDSKAETGMKARELAMLDARRKAFEKVTKENEAYAYDMEAQGLPSDEDLESAIDTFEIENEKISAKRYVGTLSMTFNEGALHRLVGGGSAGRKKVASRQQETDDENHEAMPEGEKSKKEKVSSAAANTDVLVLPIYITPDDTLFWHAKNPWNDYLDQGSKGGSIKMLVPLGDLADMKAVTIEDVMMGNHQAVDVLLNRYGKETAVVGILNCSVSDGSECELTVKLFKKGRFIFANEAVLIQGKSLQDAFKKARAALVQAVGGASNPSASEEMSEGESLAASPLKTDQYNAPTANVTTYEATATFKTLDQWQQIRSAMTASSVQSFDVSNLTRNRAKVIVRSSVALSVLMKDLARKGITVEEIAPNVLVMTVGVPIARRPLEPSQRRSDLPPGTRPLGEAAPTRMD